MNCCINCFSDDQIKKIIGQSSKIGDCDFCGHSNTGVHSVSEIDRIKELLNSVIGLYRVCDKSKNSKLLRDALKNDWNIFAVPSDVVQVLITKICKYKSAENKRVFTEPVYIPELEDEDYLSVFGIIKGRTWDQFTEIIKYDNRFHSNMFNHDAFASFLTYAVKSYHPGTVMYRARVGFDNNGFTKNELGMPPKELRIPGRVNPEGIGVLYLSSKDDTALYEARASLHDFVTVGEFRLCKEIRIINLAGITSISPFIYADTNDLKQYAVNTKYLQEIAKDIAKPLRRNDSPLEYLPTQFISEFIKNEGYDGVEYASTMTKEGYNLAVFDESNFECVNTQIFEISYLKYKPKKLKNNRLPTV